MKICDSCKHEKDEVDFYVGHRCCKQCRLAKDKQRREERKEEIKTYKKEHRLKNYDQYRSREKKYQEENRELLKERGKQKYRRVLQNAERKARFKERIKKWQESNPDKVKESRLRHRKNSPYYKYSNSLRRRINHFVKEKDFSVSDLIGCSSEEFRQYLEKQFVSGMTWENYGVHGWHIDHIIPLSSARDDLERLKQLCHYTNLQPLWAEDNRRKSNQWTPIVEAPHL
jgi:hypothetical protein